MFHHCKLSLNTICTMKCFSSYCIVDCRQQTYQLFFIVIFWLYSPFFCKLLLQFLSFFNFLSCCREKQLQVLGHFTLQWYFQEFSPRVPLHAFCHNNSLHFEDQEIWWFWIFEKSASKSCENFIKRFHQKHCQFLTLNFTVFQVIIWSKWFLTNPNLLKSVQYSKLCIASSSSKT